MTVLGFDSATPATAVALARGSGMPAEVRDDPGPGVRPRHTELLALAAELLDGAAVPWRRIERVAVDVGPGGFTGLRVGIATARALAQSLACELVGVGSLEALAYGAGAEGWEHVLAVLDARRGEVFAAAYHCAPPGPPRELEPPAALAPEALAELLGRVRARTGAERAILAAGDGALRYPEPLVDGGAVVPPRQSSLHLLRAASVCLLGGGRPAATAYESVMPDYLRRPDAEVALASAERQAAGDPGR